MARRWPGPRYEVSSTFRVPLPFAFRWCTDFTSNDPQYSAESYKRRILQRSDHRVVLEDLYDTPGGWIWIRRTIRLQPPARWHADSIGSDRALSVDYRLASLSEGRTRLTIRARRRPFGIGVKNPPKSRWERSVASNWAKFGQAMEAEYRRSRAGGLRRRGAAVS